MATYSQVFSVIILSLITIGLKGQTITFECSSPYFNKKDIETELEKYPPKLIEQYVPQIIVVDDTEENKFCGSVGWSKIKINKNCQIFKRALHHELSSIFLRRFDIYVERGTMQKMANEFAGLNGNYNYHKIPIEEANENIDATSNISHHFYGRKYAMDCFENDFNVIAENLFCDGAAAIDFISKNPDKPVTKKIQLVLAFYQALDSRQFTVDFFKAQKI